MASMARVVFAAAFEFDSDDIQCAMVMLAACLLVDIYPVNNDVINGNFISHRRHTSLFYSPRFFLSFSER